MGPKAGGNRYKVAQVSPSQSKPKRYRTCRYGKRPGDTQATDDAQVKGAYVRFTFL